MLDDHHRSDSKSGNPSSMSGNLAAPTNGAQSTPISPGHSPTLSSLPNPLSLVRCGEAARQLSVCRSTVRNWFASGILHGYRKPSKQLLISKTSIRNILQPKKEGENVESKSTSSKYILYARTSSLAQRNSCNAQLERLKKYLSETEGISLEEIEKGDSVDCFAEVGSSFGNRPFLNEIIVSLCSGGNRKYSKWFVEHKDRATRSPGEWALIKACCDYAGTELVCVNAIDVNSDEIQASLLDLISFIQVLANRKSAKRSANLTRCRVDPSHIKLFLQWHREGVTVKEMVVRAKSLRMKTLPEGMNGDKPLRYGVIRKVINENVALIQNLIPKKPKASKTTNSLALFVSKHIRKTSGRKSGNLVFARDIYVSYKSFCLKHEFYLLPAKDLGIYLQQRCGYEMVRHHRGRQYRGIRLHGKV